MSATATAVCARTLIPPLDWGVCGETQKMDRENGPKLHSAGGLHGLQRSRGERHLAQGGRRFAAVYCGGKHCSADNCDRG